MSVTFVRDEVLAQLPKWQLIRDCLEGQAAVKKARDKYLPIPNAGDRSQENLARYNAYLERAQFYNATRRTLDGLVGQVFIRKPVRELPPQLELLESDVDGVGVSLDQQAKKVLGDTMSYGRLGLLADYPRTAGPTTVAQQESGYIRPTITVYQPWNIINWRTIVVGARRLLSLVVLKEIEFYTDEEDDFTQKSRDQYRVLRLVGSYGGTPLAPTFVGEYIVELWREVANASGSKELLRVDSFRPTDANGAPLAEIPFLFVGSINNDPEIDSPPLYDLAVVNIGHYRNSADYEEACFLVGQPTPWFSGLTDHWVKEVMKGQVTLGSRAGIPLPEGGQAGLLQVSPNSMPKEAMEAKERQMVALGARLIEQRNVQRTLGEAQLEESGQASILSSVTTNVSLAYEVMLGWCAVFAGADMDAVAYTLNTDFPAVRMTSEDRAQLMAEWQGQGISFTEYRDALRKAGVATQDDETAKEEIESTPPPLKALPAKPNPNGKQTAPAMSGKAQT